MKTIARFDAPEDAYLLRAFLGSRGVEASIFDEHVAQLFWQYRYAAGGVRVVLNEEEDLPVAEAVCEEYFSALRSKPAELSEMRAWPLVLLMSLAMGLPLPIFGRRKVSAEEQPG